MDTEVVDDDEDSNLLELISKEIMGSTLINKSFLLYFIKYIITEMPGIVYWKDKNSVYLGCNNNLARISNLLSRESIIGKDDFYFEKKLNWPNETAKKFREDDQRVINTRRAHTFEDVFFQADGKEIYTLTTKTPILNNHNEIIGILAASIDITTLKQKEFQLQKAKEAAEASSQAKTEFIANMSHDIRTPLTGVIGMSQILEDDTDDPQNKQYAQWLGESGNQLLNMLNGVLDSVSAEHATDADVHDTPFNIQALILELVQLERPSTCLKNINLVSTVDNSIPPCLLGDGTKIHRILLNLLGNAIKFTQEGQVALDVRLREINPTHAVIYFSVTDTGMGIAEEMKDKIFDRFFKVTPSYKGLYKGHGLGLHIAQTYASQLGGEIKVDSTLEVGTKFYFELTLKIGDESLQVPTFSTLDEQNNILKPNSSHVYVPPINSKIIETPLNAPSILLIEDNKIALLTLENLIRQLGCHFTSAMDGETALELAKTQPFDLIITDLGLPGLSGIDFTRMLRIFEKEHQKKPMPIIGLTAHAEDKIKQACLQAGMNQAFTKPMTPTTLDFIKTTYLVSLMSASSTSDTYENPANGLKKLGLDLPDREEDLFNLDAFCLLDIDDAQASMGNDNTLLKTILKSMIEEELPEDIRDLDNAHSAGDWDAIEKMTHRMKGGLVYCGTLKLIHACQYLERYQKAGHTKLIEPLYQQLLTVVADTTVAIRKWLSPA